MGGQCLCLFSVFFIIIITVVVVVVVILFIVSVRHEEVRNSELKSLALNSGQFDSHVVVCPPHHSVPLSSLS